MGEVVRLHEIERGESVRAGSPLRAPGSASHIEKLDEINRLRAALAPFVRAYKKAADPIGDSDLYNEQRATAKAKQ